MTLRIGIDVGGTFTDFALFGDEGVVLEKALSTPDDPSRAVMVGLEKLATRRALSLGDFLAKVDAIVHATTIGDNTLIESKGAVTGLLTTAGFRDELELRRGYKEDIWDVRLLPPQPIVPRRRRLGVPERIRFDGSVALALDEDAARIAIERLARQNVESIAIALLFSFVNPEHEKRVAELVAEAMPGIPISLSHEVMPKAPEFERTSTTVVNAYIGPRLSAYLDRLEARLHEAGFARELLVMQSSGGVMTRAYLRASPVRALASGPAGGAIGAARFGVSKREPDLLCVDMGGTSYDVSLVRGGEAPVQPGWNWHHRYVVGLPMVSVETLGAGGGSICDASSGVLRVGPESASSDPGPVCYGRGGTLPTVTDAALVLGLLSDQTEFAGGSFQLTRKGVDEAFQSHVAQALGCDVEAAAFDCWRVVNANMTQAVRRWTAQRGIDPRELAMVAYGGNGPLFAAIQAQELNINRVLVPRTSPAFSALGALAASPCVDEERSYLAPAALADVTALAALVVTLRERAIRYLGDAGFGASAITHRLLLNLRYPGQNWSLAIALDDSATRAGGLDCAARDRAIQDFHSRHADEYGHARLGEEPEITGVRLVSSVETPKPEFASGFDALQRRPEPVATRRANLGRGFEDVAIYRAASLGPGCRIASPAIVEETYTTIAVYPGWELRVDDAGDYLLAAAGT